jgi:maltose O-acetyltransferase
LNVLVRNIRKLLFFMRRNPVKRLVKEGLVIGRNFSLLDDVVIDRHHCWHIKIGNDVTLAPRVHILAHDASSKCLLGYTRIGKVEIGDRVFVGASSIILPGVTVGSDVIIGAGSVVTTDVPDGVVAAGNPAKVICLTKDFIEKRAIEMKKSPVFDKEYTFESGVTETLRNEMNKKMSEKIGYII